MPNLELKKSVIPIIFATDNNYAAPTYVAVSSLVRHCDCNREYAIYILVSGNFEESSKNIFASLIQNHRNVTIEYVNMDNRVNGIRVSDDMCVKHITLATFYRIFIPELFPQYDKILYLDVDIVIQRDVAEIFDNDITGFYVGGVRQVGTIELDPDMVEQRCAELRIDNLNSYVNAGILIMNLVEWRKNDFYKKVKELATARIWPQNDQDVINSACFGKIKLLSHRYNVCAIYKGWQTVTGQVLKINYLEEVRDPVIVHYNSNKKPWFSRYNPYAIYWWEEYKLINTTAKKELLGPFVKKAKSQYTVTEKVIGFLKYQIKMLLGQKKKF